MSFFNNDGKKDVRTAPEWQAARYTLDPDQPRQATVARTYQHPMEVMNPLKGWNGWGTPSQPAKPAPAPTPAPPTQSPQDPANTWRDQVLAQVGKQGTTNFDWNNLNQAIMGMGGSTRGAAAFNAKALNGEQPFVDKAKTVNRTAYQKPILAERDKVAKAENEKAAAAQAKQADLVRQNAAAQQTAAAKAQSEAAKRQAEATRLQQMKLDNQLQAEQYGIKRDNRQLTDPFGLQYAAKQWGAQAPAGNTGITGGMTGINNQVPPTSTMQFQNFLQNWVNPNTNVVQTQQAPAQVPGNTGIVPPGTPNSQVPGPTMSIMPVKQPEAPVMRPLPQYTQSPVPGNTGITGGMTGINNAVPAPQQLSPEQRYNIQQMLQQLAMLRAGGNI